MKAGYHILNIVNEKDTVIEVSNREERNSVLNMGWVYERTARIAKNKNTVGIWKVKQLKN